MLLAAFPVLADALPPEAGHDPLLELARAMPDTRAYLGACLGALEGMHGYVLSPAELRTAITDWLANREHPNLRRFRGYLKGARARADDSLGASRRVPTRRPAPQTYDYAPTNSEEDVKWQS